MLALRNANSHLRQLFERRSPFVFYDGPTRHQELHTRLVGPSQEWGVHACIRIVPDPLAYGPSGRMASSTKGSFSTSYAVNALGQRTFKDVAASPGPTLAKEFSVYDEHGRLIGRSDGSGVALKELGYLDGFRPVATVRGSAIHRVLTDHLGTPRKVLDPTGATVWSWDNKELFGNSAPVVINGKHDKG